MENFLYVLAILFGLYFLWNLITYFPRLVGWFGTRKKQTRLINVTKNKLAIVIPARNESVVIGQLFESINKQTYGRENFDVFVVVKDASDPTIKLTEAIGGRTFVAPLQNCKGDALDLAFKQILADYQDTYKGLIVVDADCVIADTFLEEMNNSLLSGCQVCQGKRKVKNYLNDDKRANNIVTRCNGLIWTIIDDMGNRYKTDKGITNMTIGTGIMLTVDLVKQLDGWPYNKTLTEDIELSNDCVSKHIGTYYNENCIIYVEENPSLSVTNKRRYRWLKGIIDSYFLYVDQLNTLEEKSEKRNRYFVTGLLPVFRMVGACVIFSFINLALTIILALMQNPNFIISLVFGLSGFALIYLMFFVLTVTILIVGRKDVKMNFFQTIAVLFVHPIFYMGYIPIVIRAVVSNKEATWEVIDRVNLK